MERSIAKSIPHGLDLENDETDYQSLTQAYMDERKLLIDRGHEAHRDLDKWTLTLSGGALGLSITALGVLVGSDWQFDQHWLALSWLCFASSIVSVVTSIWCSARCYEEFRNAIDEAVAHDLGNWQAEAREKQSKCKYPRRIDLLNLCGIGFFALGIVLMMCFVRTVKPITEASHVKGQEREQRIEASSSSSETGQADQGR